MLVKDFDPGKTHHNRPFPKTKCTPNFAFLRPTQQPNGLPMRSDQVNVGDCNLVLRTKVLYGFAKHDSEIDVELRHERGCGVELL